MFRNPNCPRKYGEIMCTPPVRTVAVVALIALCTQFVFTQERSYPKELRGYKIQRAAVELDRKADMSSDADPDDLIRFGEPRLAGVTALGITLEIPMVVAPVKRQGHVDFLLFEDMVVNGTAVQIDEYHREFELPNKQPLVLDEPLRFSVTLPSAVLAALGEWSDSKETWRVTGRVYVFGKYKKMLFTFKRCVPVELDLSMRNPLRK